ncbi:MAG: BrnT family toxin [Desulfococcaceae bacterium]|jgi:uncharacterized protein
MKVEWDPQKAEANYKKHRVRFSDAESALFDPFALSKEDHDIESEKRFVSIGADSIGRIVVVVYTYRGDSIRMISARKATSGERKHYEKGI